MTTTGGGGIGKGIALKVLATLAFALMNALIKAASDGFGVAEIVFFRSLFAILVLFVWLVRRGEFPGSLGTQRPFGHVGRSLAGSGGMFANFLVLAILPLADATALTFVTPLLVVPLAALTLGEVVKPYRWAAVGVGFAGVLVMLSDHLGEGAARESAKFGVIVALAGAMSSAVAMIQTRRLTKSEPTGAIVFYFSSVTTVLSGALLLAASLWPAAAPGAAIAASQAFVVPSLGGFLMLASIGVLGGSGQILMTHSYRYADASIIAAFDYVAMIWAAALGLVFFAEIPTPRIVLGGMVVAGAGLYVLWRARRGSGVALALEPDADRQD